MLECVANFGENYYEFTTVHHFGAFDCSIEFAQMDIKSTAYKAWGP